MKRILLAAGFVAVFLFYTSGAMAFDSAPIGWASQNGGTTGGAGGTTVTVDNNAADFIYYVQNTKQTPYIIYVSGNINLGSSNVRVRGNKTIIGLPGSHIIGNLKSYRSTESNNIFRFLTIDNNDRLGDGDCISIDDASHIWIDHCTFTDGGDGNVDIKNGADYITVSWCIFKYTHDSGHNYSNLIGHADDNGGTDANHLLVTFHHNWYSTLCKERMPRVRYGQVHVYNNYYSDLLAGGYCVGVGCGSHIRVESNYFNAVPMPWKDYYSDYPTYPVGHIGWNTGNIYYNCTEPTWATNEYATIFTPPYDYTLDDAEDIRATVQYGAGADGNDGNPPHWLFTMYGDFDRSGFVDMNDFAQFARYWPVNDCNQLSDADYNGDCKVNFYEFALFAENWLYIPPDTTAPAAPTGFWALAGNGTVSLEWADNNEADFDGYNIYRSTTSGSGYSKLNGSLLSDSNYIDNSIVNGTMYYYVVTAADTSSNESGYSVEACAVPDSNGNSVTLQENATGFCSVDGAVENEWSGYTGAGYANTDNALGNGINWKTNVPSDGNYTFVWRYALVSGDRTGKLIVNGTTVVPSISFPYSGAVTTYIETSPVDVNLTAGINNIRLEATTVDGLANIDYLKIIGNNPQAASCQ
jgi:pectate lyase